MGDMVSIKRLTTKTLTCYRWRISKCFAKDVIHNRLMFLYNEVPVLGLKLVLQLYFLITEAELNICFSLLNLSRNIARVLHKERHINNELQNMLGTIVVF